MKTIYKYRIDGVKHLELPEGAKVIHAAMQNNSPHIWVEYPVFVDSDDFEERRFTCYGTGFEVPDSSIHIGSMIDEDFVWHIYEDLL